MISTRPSKAKIWISPAGLLDVGNMKRNLQLKGQFHTAQDIAQIIVRSPNGGSAVYLKDIATIKDTIKDRESYARLDGKMWLR